MANQPLEKLATKATKFGQIMAIMPFMVIQGHKFGTNQKPICGLTYIYAHIVINLTYLLSCTISMLYLIICQIFASNRG